MHSVFWAFFCSLSIFLAGIIGIIRFRKINKIYYSFLFSIWCACINEFIAFISFKTHHNVSVSNNIYVLAESLLITVFFRDLCVIKKPKSLFPIIISLLIAIWILENFIFGSITTIGAYFRIFYSFIIVLMSIQYINVLIGSSNKLKLQNVDFIICLAFILYFTFKVLVQSFWLYGLNSKQDFLLKVFTIMIFINLIANLIYALAVLWMPRKIEYTQPY